MHYVIKIRICSFFIYAFTYQLRVVPPEEKNEIGKMISQLNTNALLYGEVRFSALNSGALKMWSNEKSQTYNHRAKNCDVMDASPSYVILMRPELPEIAVYVCCSHASKP